MATALAEYPYDTWAVPAEVQALLDAGTHRKVMDPQSPNFRLEPIQAPEAPTQEPAQAPPEKPPVAPVTRDPFQNAPKPRKPAPAPQKPAEAPVAEKPVKATAKKTRTNKAGASIPRPEVPYRQPQDQNEHWHAVYRLLRGYAQWVALIAHHEIAVEHRSNFCGGKRELSADFLASKTGMSPNQARVQMAEAVKAGLFVRVDNGNGGRSGKNRATYMAVVPDLDRKPSTVKGPRDGDTSLGM